MSLFLSTRLGMLATWAGLSFSIETKCSTSAAMGVNVATVFSEFGDKQGLYVQALERPGAHLQTVLQVLRDLAVRADRARPPAAIVRPQTLQLPG